MGTIKDLALTPEDKSWFDHDRFGIFIHWGIYTMSGYEASWGIYWGQQTVADYDRYFSEFDPDLFDPKDWARRAKAAGMKYAVIGAKHHDGFCLWDSAFTQFKVTNTPAGRDLIGATIKAFREEGLRIGIYYSLIDWNHPHFTIDPLHPLRNEPDVEARNAQRDQRIYQQYMKGQVRELMTSYGEIDYLWFDFSYPEWGPKRERGKGYLEWDSEGMLRMIREINPKCLVNNRLNLPTTDGFLPDVTTPEQYVPLQPWVIDGKPVTWEACLTLGGIWAYTPIDKDWKTPGQLIRIMVDTVSLGGNLLMNIGPTARGSLSKETQAGLAAYAGWMGVHAESIIGCGSSDFVPPRDCRYTQNGKTLYLHIFAWPLNYLHLQGLSGKMRSAKFAWDDTNIEIVDYNSLPADNITPVVPQGTLTLKLPTQQPDYEVVVIKIELI